MTPNLLNSFIKFPVDGVFDSMYESFNPLTTVNPQHFVEWCSGNDLDSIWSLVDLTGTGSKGMNDSIGGGAFVKTGGGAADASQLTFNGIDQYNFVDSVFLGVVKRTSSNVFCRFGFTSDGTTSTNLDIADYENNSGDTFTSLRTGDASITSTTASTTAVNTNFNGIKILTASASITLFELGVSSIVKTTNRPTAALEPIIRVESSSGATVKEIDVRYLEVYNT